MNVRILVATANADEILFLQEVLEDIQTGRHWRGWVSIQPVMAMSLNDAIAALGEQSVDVIVLNTALCGGRPLAAFRRLQDAAPFTPVILLARPDETEIAIGLMRLGAQDFLIAHSVDAVPLAHALGTAIERHRILSGARTACMEDPLTGLLNGAAFLALADRDRRLAEKLGCRWMMLLAEPGEATLSEPAAYCDTESVAPQRRDLFLIEAADRLRRLAAPIDLLARLSEFRFGLGIFDTPCETVEAARSRVRSAARENRIAVGAAIFDFAQPCSLEILIEQAELDLTPRTMAVRT